METFKFVKGKYTNEKVVADSGVIKAVLSNGTDVTNSVNDDTFQTAALASDNVSGKEIKVYTLRKSLSNINPIGEVTSDNTVRISSLGVTKSPSGVALPQAAATELSKTPATATLPNEINWNISSGDAKTNVNVTVGEATVAKTAKFTISGNVSVKKFVKASGDLDGQPVFTEENLNTNGSSGTGYYSDGRKCVANKEHCDVVSSGKPYKYDSEDTYTYYTYDSEERVQSSSENCNISKNMLVANQTSFKKENDENSIYLNARVDDVRKMVEFQ